MKKLWVKNIRISKTWLKRKNLLKEDVTRGGRGSSTNNLKAEYKSAQSRRDFFMKARDNARNIEEYKAYDEKVKKYGQKVVDILNATKGKI